MCVNSSEKLGSFAHRSDEDNGPCDLQPLQKCMEGLCQERCGEDGEHISGIISPLKWISLQKAHWRTSSPASSSTRGWGHTGSFLTCPFLAIPLHTTRVALIFSGA